MFVYFLNEQVKVFLKRKLKTSEEEVEDDLG